ncbi:MAG: Cytochrome oxidase biogenesis protein Surf1, facilitates heme A insertion [uncultured Sphingosinicella sp.]|uniref:SURF1-like protein n=1 Tax=uncultured Sphingosinicella sp. TaxID=478748 RepID=A0A6J4U9I7_9SPHN|nr:SURF1 family protein [uncultured Sphingosinicella sp.]CAA9544633.1 MAG: Cytochrome oxidase biogenesis protein Surf1, facilitates heme A insertion [uncultured Sphingosinicella sp.]
MMRWPLIPTVVVAAAVAVMIALGVWQLQRKGEKEALIAQYREASGLPPIAYPSVPTQDAKLFYRRADGFCLEPVGWRSTAGRNMQDQTGWSHIVSCRTGGVEGPGMQVDMGWSKSSTSPAGWKGGAVSGIIAPDRLHKIRLVSSQAAPGLVPSARPSPEATPNNHLLYALQWFFFAAGAAVVYVLALRKRQGNPPA